MLNKKYELSLDYYQKALVIVKILKNIQYEANIVYNIARAYQSWGKYEQAINYYQQSRELYQQLAQDKDVANQWYWLANCYREWGKYELAIDCQNKDLAIRQQLDDQVRIALGYFQLGRIYQSWGKYEQAINYYQQSRELYQQLAQDKDVANQWDWLANCYRECGKYELAIDCQNKDLAIRQQLDDQVNIADAYFQLGRIYQSWNKYEQAINYYQQSRQIYQQLAQDKNVARLYGQLAFCQCLSSKNPLDSTEISSLLTQAEENIRQAIEINTVSEYKENLAYDYTIFSLIYSEHLRLLPSEDTSIREKIALFEEYYHRSLTYFDELGKTVEKADEALDIARAYLEVEVLENLNRSEEIAQDCLQIFQDYNRRNFEASARKFLGEIYLKRTQQNQPGTKTIATQFFADSLQIYRDLDLQEKAVEVEELINTLGCFLVKD